MGIQLVERVADQVPRAPVKRVLAIKVYLCCDERTAWRGARTSRWLDGFLNLSLLEAQVQCEDSRTKGSTWFIYEHPGLMVESTDGWLIATEMQEDNPLQRFRASLPEDDGLKFYGIESREPLAPGMDIRSAAYALQPRSPFWKKPVPTSDFVMGWLHESQGCLSRQVAGFTKVIRDAHAPTPVDKQAFRQFTASSSGGGEPLDWTTQETGARAAAVTRLQESIRRLSSAPQRGDA